MGRVYCRLILGRPDRVRLAEIGVQRLAAPRGLASMRRIIEAVNAAPQRRISNVVPAPLYAVSAAEMTSRPGIEIGTAPPMTGDTPANCFRASVCALLIVGIVPSAAWSQDQQGFAKVGGYAGGSFVPKFTLDGETFDGFTYYQQVDGDEIAILPKLDKQNMFRGILGYRGEKAAIELSYEHTSHQGAFGEGTGRATFQQVNVDGRFFFLTRERIQPYLLLGGGIPWLTIKDGSFLENQPVASATARSMVLRSIPRLASRCIHIRRSGL